MCGGKTLCFLAFLLLLSLVWLLPGCGKDDTETAEQQAWEYRYEDLLTQVDGLTEQIEMLEAAPPETVTVRETQTVKEVTEVPIYTELREFESVAALREWLDGWVYVANSVNGTVDFLGDDNDCDDWSLAMVRDAVRDGYIAGVVLDTEESHLFVCCIIGNRFYFVEPQSGDVFEVLHNTYWLID